MGMSTGNNEAGANAEINITPLADVMLVLLIIFMITAPLASHQIKVTLPKADPPKEKVENKVPPIDLAIEANGTLYWDDKEVTQDQLRDRLRVAAQKSPQPPLQIRADKTTHYRLIRKALETAKGTGMVHINFVTHQEKKPGQ